MGNSFRLTPIVMKSH